MCRRPSKLPSYMAASSFWCSNILQKTAGKEEDPDKLKCKKGKGTQACGAIVIMNDGITYEGQYNGATGIHAEMAALSAVIAAGRQLAHIAEIHITSPPCPRCAFMLLLLGLAGRVRYPKGTNQRTGPGWKLPDDLNDPKLFDRDAWGTTRQSASTLGGCTCEGGTATFGRIVYVLQTGN